MKKSLIVTLAGIVVVFVVASFTVLSTKVYEKRN